MRRRNSYQHIKGGQRPVPREPTNLSRILTNQTRDTWPIEMPTCVPQDHLVIATAIEGESMKISMDRLRAAALVAFATIAVTMAAIPAAAQSSYAADRVIAVHSYSVPSEDGSTVSIEIETTTTFGDGQSGTINSSYEAQRTVYVIVDGERELANAELTTWADMYLATPDLLIDGQTVVFDTSDGDGFNPGATTLTRCAVPSDRSTCRRFESPASTRPVGTRPES